MTPQAGGNPWGSSPYTTGEIATQARYLYDTFAAPFMLLMLGAVAFIVVIGAVMSVYRGAAKK